MKEERGVTFLPARPARGLRRGSARPARVGDGRAPMVRALAEPAAAVAFWSFELVEERLVEAWGFLQRMPDRELGWHRVFASDGPWREVTPERHERFEEAKPARLGLRAAEVDRMEATLGWLRFIRPVDRKLLGLALKGQASRQAHVDWIAVKRAMGWGGTPDALRMRYSRAITAIANALNGADFRRAGVSR